MTTIKEGDRVEIVDRDATAEDVKSGLFYNHFRGLTGTVQKLHSSEEVSVEIEAEPARSGCRSPSGCAGEDEGEMARWALRRGAKPSDRPGARFSAALYRACGCRGCDQCDRQSGGHSGNPPATSEETRRATSADLSAAEEAEIARRQRSQ